MIKSFIYSNEKSSAAIPRDVLDRMDANVKYSEHFYNLMYLEFILNNKNSTPQEKTQAESEIEIAKRKMKWWKNQQSWDASICGKLTSKIKKDWSSRPCD